MNNATVESNYFEGEEEKYVHDDQRVVIIIARALETLLPCLSSILTQFEHLDNNTCCSIHVLTYIHFAITIHIQ